MPTRAVKATAAATIRRPRHEVYAHWRDFTKLPGFMEHLQSVEVRDATRSHWTAKAPGGRTVEWDAEIVADLPGERISWRSTEGSDVDSSGTVRFAAAPADQGTEVHVALEVRPPLGSVGALVAKLFGEDPRQQVRDDLRRFKQVMETGEVIRSDASPRGVRTINALRQRAGQPAGRPERATS